MAKQETPEQLLWQRPEPGLRLVGIARLATMGEAVESGHNVEFATLPTRSLLNRCTARNMPFTWTINPYRGCEFACKYCYARYAHEFMEKDPIEFERQIFIKENVAWLLQQELKRVRAGDGIAIGTATDPYQPAERRHQLTRSILEVFARASGHDIGIVTKSNLILRDLDLLLRIHEHNHLRLHLTVTTTNAALARKLEPRAPRPDLRLEAVRRLRLSGLRAGVLCCPVLPYITDSESNLDAVIAAAKQADASFVAANPLYLRTCSQKVFMPFLREHFPHLMRTYERTYNDHNSFVSQEYADLLRARVEKLCLKHHIRHRAEMERAITPQFSQLDLFG